MGAAPDLIREAERAVCEAAAALEAARVALARSLEDGEPADDLEKLERELVVREAECRLGRAHLELRRMAERS